MATRMVATDVVSAYHLLSVLTAARELEQRGQKIVNVDIHLLPNSNGVILNPPGDVSWAGRSLRYVQTPTGHYGVALGVKIVAFLLGRLRRRFVDCDANCVWLAHHTYFKPTSLQHLSVSEAFRARTVSFEEGVGSLGDMHHHARTRKQFGVKLARLKYVLRQLLRRKFFIDVSSGLLRRPSSAVAYEAIGDLQKALHLTEHLKGELQEYDGRDCRLFIGSPLREAGIIDGYSYLKLLEDVVRQHSDDCFVAKPHPLETDAEVYLLAGMKVIGASTAPGELLLASGQFSYVHGFNSGLLILAGSLFDLPSICESDRLPHAARAQVSPTGVLAELFDAYTQREFAAQEDDAP